MFIYFNNVLMDKDFNQIIVKMPVDEYLLSDAATQAERELFLGQNIAYVLMGGTVWPGGAERVVVSGCP